MHDGFINETNIVSSLRVSGSMSSNLVPREGIEPPTPASSGLRSTTELSRLNDENCSIGLIKIAIRKRFVYSWGRNTRPTRPHKASLWGRRSEEMKTKFSSPSSLALIVQWIEQFRPKEKMGVRFSLRAQNKITRRSGWFYSLVS